MKTDDFDKQATNHLSFMRVFSHYQKL